MSPKRSPENKGLPARVTHKHGAYYEMLAEELAGYHNQHRCGCGDPECNRCADDERIEELLAQSEQAV